MSLAAGTQIGVYEIKSLIGKGGMGEVYRAWDPRLGREVAIKILSERLIENQDAFSRFKREARVLAALSHSSIITIYDIVFENKSLFVVMELLDGESLRDRILRDAVPWTE